MAKKHNTTKAEQNQMLETPTGSATESPVRADWPESTEVRELSVSLTEPEINETARDLVDRLREVESLNASKKASADHYKSKIEEVEKKIEDLSTVVKSGKDRRSIPCRWLFQTNNFDASGAAIFHSEMKTLIREDTGEMVEVKPITSEDRQMNLPLSDEETMEVNMDAIADAGFTLAETTDGTAPFLLTSPFGEQSEIHADSMAEAAAKARALLPAAKPDEETNDEDFAE